VAHEELELGGWGVGCEGGDKWGPLPAACSEVVVRTGEWAAAARATAGSAVAGSAERLLQERGGEGWGG